MMHAELTISVNKGKTLSLWAKNKSVLLKTPAVRPTRYTSVVKKLPNRTAMLPAPDGSEAVLFAPKPCIGNAPHELAIVSISWLYLPLIPFTSLVPGFWVHGLRGPRTGKFILKFLLLLHF
jgi:hypothetical protein